MRKARNAALTRVRPMAGFSIIELMVAVAISMMLLTGVVAIFASSRNSYESTDQLSRIQESGRFALDTVSRHIRAAGFVGCARQPTYISTTLNSATALQWNYQEGPVRGFQYVGPGWTPAIDASVVTPAQGSDVLVLRVPARDVAPVQVTDDMGSSTSDVTVTATTAAGLRVGDIAIAYSCEAQSVFQISAFPTGTTIGHAVIAASATAPGNSSDDLSYTYRQRVTQVVPVETVIYYIRASSQANITLPPDSASLWRRVGLQPAEELIEGVEQMQLQFGVDTDGDVIVDDYLTAAAVTDWREVISVSVALLVRSANEYGADTDRRVHQVLDVNVAAAGDRRLREVFAATASIRNRVRVN